MWMVVFFRIDTHQPAMSRAETEYVANALGNYSLGVYGIIQHK